MLALVIHFQLHCQKKFSRGGAKNPPGFLWAQLRPEFEKSPC